MDGIYPDDGIHLVEGTVTPGLNLIPHLIGDVADCLLRDLAAIVLLYEVAELLQALTTA